MNWMGNPELEELLVGIETIQTHPRNPRRGDLTLLAESLDAFGQTRPIVVQPSTGHIVAGNHTYRAAVEVLGWTHIAAVKPVLEDGEYEKYLLMDNRASDASEYDEDVLIPILRRLDELGEFAHTGWDAGEASDVVAAADRISQRAEEEYRGGYVESPEDAERREAQKQTREAPHQLMLAYANDAFGELSNGLLLLRREYATNGTSETIMRAVDEQFEREWQGRT